MAIQAQQYEQREKREMEFHLQELIDHNLRLMSRAENESDGTSKLTRRAGVRLLTR